MTDNPLPIEINGSVRIESGEQKFIVRAEGGHVVIAIPDVGTLKTLLASPGDSEQLNFVTDLLKRYDLDVTIELKGEIIAKLGSNAEPGAFEKMFSLGAVDVKKRQLIKALFKRGD
ncbi:MAG: hypothetical protein AAGL98_02920 [Planctomycetota bacterium]